MKNMEGKVAVNVLIKMLYDDVSQLSTSVKNLMTENEKFSSQLIAVSNIDTLLVACVTVIEKQQTKMEQYSNVEITCISNDVPDENLERKVIDICKAAGIDLKPYDIEGCYRLPSRLNISNSKRVIVSFVNRKHSKAMLRFKKLVNLRSNVYITNSLCPYYHFL